MRYAILLRGINVGGKNKVDMKELKALVSGLGYDKVSTYINSGNIFFDSDEDINLIKKMINNLLEARYSFIKNSVFISKIEYDRDYEELPIWWQEDLARKDVLFYSEEVDKNHLEESVKNLPMTKNEEVHFGKIGIYWGKYDEREYLKTAYHRHLLKLPEYKAITIRNGKTFDKIGEYLNG